MKTSVMLLAFSLAAGATLACAPNPAERARVAQSRAEWEGLKAAHRPTYRYTVLGASWVGTSWETVIDVRDDRPVRRAFSSKDPDGAPGEAWVEEATELGRHSYAAPVLTIDQIYDHCENEVLSKSPDQNLISVSFHPDGLLENCSYFPRQCQDDCSMGVGITTLTFASQ